MMWVIIAAIIAGIIGFFWRPRAVSTWQVSENGNKTRIVDGTRVTIFASDGGWKYCLADQGNRYEPFFSDRYRSEAEAIESALADIEGRDSPHKSTRQLRDEREAVRAAEVISAAPETFTKAQSQLSDMHASQKFKLTELRPIQKRLERLQKNLLQAFPHAADASDQQKSDELWAFYDKVKRLEEHSRALITWKEGEGNGTSLTPPTWPGVN
ncbi:hypothetical protein KYK30_31760 [Shinella yambaruensis]|uniref:Uncharacterized protein n=1 Tax=Shinella yambaruensis TaxID=415996 RepID=A0ABQ5ZUR9_9HYPH|nr:hypothetical protein [Shinella yambaruensis]MCJ8030010.1 hypothetical protein [Shinella yambaruensis]MCU7984302.1 hypothetical protein [Shinella yambaruensis]GLR55130.1 hypothetical protein GCM10007923_63510 [Shinella yambaruensis]